MSALGTWSDEDIVYAAETLGCLERQIVLLCSERRTFGYRRLAEMTNVSYDEAQRVGRFLQGANLAEVRLLRPGYNGSGIFLNDNGERLRQELQARQNED